MNKMHKAIRKFYWWCFVIWLSLGWIKRNNLGDLVWYQGKKFSLIQGVCNPYWDISNGEERLHVHKDQFRKVKTLSNFYVSFRSGYRFYMGYWYSIWVHDGIKPWMRNAKIWGKN